MFTINRFNLPLLRLIASGKFNAFSILEKGIVMKKHIFVTTIVGMFIAACGGGGSGPAYPLPILEINGHVVDLEDPACPFVDYLDRFQNCMLPADQYDLSGDSMYWLQMDVRNPQRDIDMLHVVITQTSTGATVLNYQDYITWLAPQANPETIIFIYNTTNAECGEYQIDVWLIDIDGDPSPVYTFDVEVTQNCI
jgi:hypothetical protein